MGTRSLTVFYDSYDMVPESEIVVMYRQFDGYLEGHGVELAEFLKEFTVVNGISPADQGRIANGMGCLSAQAIEYFKREHGVGGIYLHPAGTRDCSEEYVYEVRCPNGGGVVQMKCSHTYGDGREVFAGTPEDFLTWVLEQREEEVT